MSLKIKTKLRYGIGLLFAMIVLLGGLSVKNISDMSADTRNILADNYNSLLYSRRMLDALERIDSDPSAQADFEKNLGLQKKNITEVDENVATSHLVAQYEQLAKERNEENIRRVRLALNQVMSLNMASIYRKSQVAESTSQKALFWIWGIGLSCMVVAFAFLIRFPRSINTPIRMLMDGIMEIANHNYEKRLDLAKYDEFEGVAKSFNRMAERLTEYRKSTLADIIQGKKYIEAIVNSITEPIIGLDRDRKILFANNEALTILNLKRENVIGKSASELSLRNDLLRRLVRELIQPSEKKEPLKIWGKIENGEIVPAESPKFTAQCIRVPVSDGHLASVFVDFKKKPTKEEILEIWENYSGEPQSLSLPHAPKQFLHYYTEDDMPQTKLCRDSEGGMAISVGRLREDTQYDYKFVCVSHNTLRGAAGGAVLLAELLCAKGYMD
mgnify:CR=1 FL=1